MSNNEDLNSAPEANGVNKGGRPEKVFTDEEKEQIRRLSEIFSSQEDIAYVMGINRTTLLKHPELMNEGKARGRVKLRRAQMEKALEGNPALLIWLGKNLLGQQETPTQTDDNLILPWESPKPIRDD